VRLLLDSHVLVWWLAGDETLSPAAREAIGETANEVFVSAVSSWQVAVKHRVGQMPQAGFLTGDAGSIIAEQGFTELPLSVRHGQVAGSLPSLTPDPFIRALVAQAIVEELVVVSDQAAFDTYGVSRLW
jgi:PIN domain nuclease of toxin-antitoxin system